MMLDTRAQNGKRTGVMPSPTNRRCGSGRQTTAWLLALPAIAFYTVFALWPLVDGLRYSLYEWNGIGAARWVGLGNYERILTDADLLRPVRNAMTLILFFTGIPVTLGLVLASLLRAIRNPPLAAVARTVLFLPQVIPLAAAGIAWSWMYSQTGALNQLLDTVGLESLSRPWLGDFDVALPAVGLIGSWVLTGLCTVMLLTGMSKIDPALYESVRLDGGGWLGEFRAVTVPCLRNEIGVLVTLTMIAALASFAIIFSTTGGGPGGSTTVPSVEIYRLGFGERQIGLASALGVVVILLVLAIILPVQRLFRERST